MVLSVLPFSGAAVKRRGTMSLAVLANDAKTHQITA